MRRRFSLESTAPVRPFSLFGREPYIEMLLPCVPSGERDETLCALCHDGDDYDDRQNDDGSKFNGFSFS